MNSDGRLTRLVLSCALALVAASMPAFSEVGVRLQDSGLPSTYHMQIIVDDPEPSGIAWQRYYPDGPDRFVLNDQGVANGDGAPSMIFSSTLPIVAWSRNSPGGFDVVVSRFTGGAWTTPQVVASSSADEMDPALVLDPDDGTVHLLYWVLDGAPRVMHRMAPSDLSSWSAPTQVSEPGEIACRPAGVFRDGTLHVVYEVHGLGYGTTPRQIVHATHDGVEFQTEVVATTQHDEDNWPQVHSAQGRVWVDWIDTHCDLAWILQQPGGGWDPIETEYFETPEERDYRVRQQVRLLVLP